MHCTRKCSFFIIHIFLKINYVAHQLQKCWYHSMWKFLANLWDYLWIKNDIRVSEVVAIYLKKKTKVWVHQFSMLWVGPIEINFFSSLVDRTQMQPKTYITLPTLYYLGCKSHLPVVLSNINEAVFVYFKTIITEKCLQSAQKWVKYSRIATWLCHIHQNIMKCPIDCIHLVQLI